MLITSPWRLILLKENSNESSNCSDADSLLDALTSCAIEVGEQVDDLIAEAVDAAPIKGAVWNLFDWDEDSVVWQ